MVSKRLDAVRSGALDAALIRGEERLPGLEFVPLWEDALLVALPAGHPPAGRERPGPADLARRPAGAARATGAQRGLPRSRHPGRAGRGRGRRSAVLDGIRRGPAAAGDAQGRPPRLGR
ncbi:LysR substrate-binding domain-containing protein, partial [Kitasatospora sp. NPDC127111]|uniref:LysR substrate-binding domain-containing protein n=1 Tax=Kitasatospora sp. NPDC127111 TaxID=3345363 RepID=UPI00363B24CC